MNWWHGQVSQDLSPFRPGCIFFVQCLLSLCAGQGLLDDKRLQCFQVLQEVGGGTMIPLAGSSIILQGSPNRLSQALLCTIMSWIGYHPRVVLQRFSLCWGSQQCTS
jgi:hypothetical protein